jgi:hypothetical protein
MFATDKYTLAAGVTTAISGISFVGSLYFNVVAKREERSLKQIIGQETVSPPEILQILERFGDDANRLQALEMLLGERRKHAAGLYERIRKNIDVESLVKSQARHNFRKARTMTLAVLTLSVCLWSVTPVENMTARIGNENQPQGHRAAAHIDPKSSAPSEPVTNSTGIGPIRTEGKEPPAVSVFSVDQYYVASGKMGDIGDVEIGGSIFSYAPRGLGPHEYEWKYDPSGKLATNPAKFGGVLWLSPANAFGTDPDGGYNLSGFKKVRWEARSQGKPFNVEFFIGSVQWNWETKNGVPERSTAAYPDTMPRKSLGIKKLTSEWEEFQVSLSDQPEKNFKRLVGGFGWVANWNNNGFTETDTNLVFKFEVKNIRYEK